MFRKVMLAVCVGVIGLLGGVQVYGQDAGTLAAALDKNKYKKKDKSKKGVSVSVEVYVDIKNEPVVRQPAEYSGRYADEYGGFSLELSVAADGSAEGSGFDTINGGSNASKMNYTLRNARVQGAVLTAEKVYADGTSQRLEAVFVNQTVVLGKNAQTIESRNTVFGLGFVQKNGDWMNRVFLAAK
jgi:hypothetical protein